MSARTTAQALAHATGPASAHATGPGSAILSRFGLAAAERLATSEQPEERLRGMERLAGMRERPAVERLVQLLEPDPFAADDARAALIAVRGMEGFATHDNVLRMLTKLAGLDGAHGPLVVLVRDTAALVLAESGDSKALEILYKNVQQGGSAGISARRALVAHPPVSFWRGWNNQDRLTVGACELFGELGDLRAVPLLRNALNAASRTPPNAAPELSISPIGGEPSGASDRALRIAAALALARLGDQAQVPAAREWTRGTDAVLRKAGWAVLLASGAPELGGALMWLFATPRADEVAIELAMHAQDGNLLGQIEARLSAMAATATASGAVGATTSAAGLIGAVGQIGTASAWQSLNRMLSNPMWASHAAYVLMQAPGDAPRQALEQALNRDNRDNRDETRRVAARAAAVRVRVFHDEIAGLARALAELWQSRDPADRAAGAFGAALAGEGTTAPDGSSLWASTDLVVVRAAAKALLVATPGAVLQAARRMSTESDPMTRIALGLALAARPEAAEVISTEQLVSWVSDRSPLSPLAAVVLGTRERQETEGRLKHLLYDPNPVLRAHAALALAHSPQPDSASRLANRWQFEADTDVRFAVVRALALRSEPQRLPVLRWAARLDPDADIRELARAALAGIPLDPPWPTQDRCIGHGRTLGMDVIWTSVGRAPEVTPKERVAPAPASGMPRGRARTVTTTEPAEPRPVARAGVVVDRWGVALPVVPDPDGAVIIPGARAPTGGGAFELASWLPEDKAPIP